MCGRGDRSCSPGSPCRWLVAGCGFGWASTGVIPEASASANAIFSFILSSMLIDRTPGPDARIQIFVACSFSFSAFKWKFASAQPKAVAAFGGAVYCHSQDDFYLQPVFVYLPLLAHNSGLGGVTSSEPLCIKSSPEQVQLNGYPPE